MPQKKHVHQAPNYKGIGHYWALDFGAANHFKSLLMGWTRAGTSTYSFMGCPYSSHFMHLKFAKLQDAVGFAEMNGWGYDITHPKYKWF